MEFSANYQFIAESPHLWAQNRESEGWDGVVCADHYWINNGDRSLPAPHVWVTLSTMAASTVRVRVGSAFSNNLLRSPVEFAQASLSLQRDSDGRAEAGLGAGWQEDELRLTGQPYPDGPTRATMFREAVTVVRELLRSGSISFHGEHYQIDVPSLGPLSAKPPPLIAAVGGPRTTREVTPLVDRVELKMGRSTRGGHLDWGALSSVTIDEVISMVRRVREVRADVPIGVLAFVAVGNDERVARLAHLLGNQLYGSFVGDAGCVAEAIRELEAIGIDRVNVCEWTPNSYAPLADALGLHA